MTDHDPLPEGPLPEGPLPQGDVPAAWQQADDTLADAAAEHVPAGSQGWLAQQRFVHGLLRALHTADAAAREARLQNLLQSIDVERAAVPRTGSRHWLLVAAAALLFAALGIYAVLPPRLPTAEAAVQRVVEHLARDVDLRYQLLLTAVDADGVEKLRHEFDLVTRPGMRFLVDGKLSFGTMQLGEFRIGCDGDELWARSANGAMRRAMPITERERLLQGLGDVLDLGYLDVHAMVRRLPEDFELKVVGAEQAANGRRLLRIEASRERGGRRPVLRSAWLLCDEETGMVTRLQVQTATGRGLVREVAFELIGEEPAGTIDYRKPW